MGRHKKEVRLNKVISYKVTEEQYNLIKALSKEDKDIFNSKLKQFTEKYISLLLSQGKILVDQNNIGRPKKDSSEILVDQNNDDKILVDQNNAKTADDWTQDEISGFLAECEEKDKLQNAVNKGFKPVKRNKKELSQAEIDMLLVNSENDNGVNSLFEGSCE